MNETLKCLNKFKKERLIKNKPYDVIELVDFDFDVNYFSCL